MGNAIAVFKGESIRDVCLHVPAYLCTYTMYRRKYSGEKINADSETGESESGASPGYVLQPRGELMGDEPR